MRTYTHGVIGYLLYLKGSVNEQKLAVIGAMIPDVLLVSGFIFHFLGSNAIAKILHNFFHHSVVHLFTEVMHSFIIIIPLLVLAFFFYKISVPFFVGMLSHSFIDLLTHQNSLYNHFLPLPIDPIAGIVSYTTFWFTVIEHIMLLAFIVWVRKKK